MFTKLLNILKKKKKKSVSAPLNQLQSNAEVSKKLRELKRDQKNSR